MLGITAVTRIGYLLKMFIIVTLVIVQTSINLLSLKQSFNAYDTLTYQSELRKRAQQDAIATSQVGGSAAGSGEATSNSEIDNNVVDDGPNDDLEGIPINEDQLERTIQMNAFFGHEYTLTLVIVTITIALFLINRQVR